MTNTTKDAFWLDKVRRATVEPWSADLGRCLACMARAEGCRFGLTTERVVEGELTAEVMLGTEHEGGPDVAHGGVVSAILDEALGHAVMSHGVLVVTSMRTIDFLKPVPIGVPLAARARIVSQEGRRWKVEGEIVVAGSNGSLARGHGVWVAVPDGHYERHRVWLDGERR
jgi:uncharacterized protein (TIGR00369 family)